MLIKKCRVVQKQTLVGLREDKKYKDKLNIDHKEQLSKDYNINMMKMIQDRGTNLIYKNSRKKPYPNNKGDSSHLKRVRIKPSFRNQLLIQNKQLNNLNFISDLLNKRVGKEKIMRICLL